MNEEVKEQSTAHDNVEDKLQQMQENMEKQKAADEARLLQINEALKTTAPEISTTLFAIQGNIGLILDLIDSAMLSPNVSDKERAMMQQVAYTVTIGVSEKMLDVLYDNLVVQAEDEEVEETTTV